jgi:NAD(P)-dependent dehydrogenase (short-subunit alcohol dehydrogenase family)
MNVNLKGKAAIVTGGGSGVGKATCFALAKKGVKVGVYGRTLSKCETVANEINANGGNAIALKGDVANSTDVKNAIDSVIKKFGSLDILINSAGVCVQKRLLDSTEKEFDLIMGSNVKGTYLLTKAAYAVMKKQNNGHIINISSGAAGWPGANEILYGTAKTAQVKFTLHTKFEFEQENRIRENNNQDKGEFYIHALCPGAIDTPMSDDLGRPKDKRDNFLSAENLADTIINLLENPEKGHKELKIEAENLDYNLDEAGYFEQFEYIIRIWKD